MTKRTFFIGCGLVLFFLFLYFITTNQLFSFDAITNAIACESNEPIRWFHANHLLYPAVGVLYHRLERLFGYQGLSLYSLARLNSGLMTAGLAVLFGSLVPVMGRKKSLVSVFLFGVCYAVWAYAVDGRAIGTAVFFAALVISILLSIERGASPSASIAVGLGVLSSLYVFGHAIGVFHVIPVSLYVFQKSGYKRKIVTLYLAAFGLLVGVAYLVCYWIFVPDRSWIQFLKWAVGYAGYSNPSHPSHGFWAPSFLAVIQGLWIGWKYAFYPGFPSLGFIGEFLSHGLGVLMAVLTFGGIWKGREQSRFSLSHVLFIWGGLCLLFLSIWSPGQEGFRLHVITPWFVACCLVLYKRRFFLSTMGVLACGIFLLNLTGPLAYAADIRHNTGYQLTKELSLNIKDGDVFICATKDFIPSFEVIRPYFFPKIKGGTVSGRLFAFGESSLENLTQRLRILEKSGSTLYWGEDLFDPVNQSTIEKSFNLEPGDVKKMVDQFGLKPSFNLSNGRTVYVTTRN